DNGPQDLVTVSLCILIGVHKMQLSAFEGTLLVITPDPYVKDTQNPSWSAIFNFLNVASSAFLKFEIWEKDLNFDDHLGTCTTKLRSGTHSVTCGLSSGTFYYTYRCQ
uniref:C2 domain-containing protein n=1 Tax=Oncorhynchus tshawytscha TaxID=74940 RepID=A0A8C8K2W0_ONCTS